MGSEILQCFSGNYISLFIRVDLACVNNNEKQSVDSAFVNNNEKLSDGNELSLSTIKSYNVDQVTFI